MGFEPGGRADKLGNRYEGRWLVKQFLLLLTEEIASVTLEAIGDDEVGVDLWISKNGPREAHQCKARNGSEESWKIGALTRRGVLEHLRFQLDREPKCEYVFVSGLPATFLNDICNSARNSNENPEDFYNHQIKNVGRERDKVFSQFIKALGLDINEKDDLARAFNYLRRIRFELYPDDKNAWNDLKCITELLLDGEPETAIALMQSYPENEDLLGKPIYADDLREYLSRNNILPKNLVKDSRIIPVIERLREEFEDSISYGLINSELIPREETKKCLDALERNGVVILHGVAGSGKSGILYELTRILRDEKIPWLPLRLDRRIPNHTALHFGKDVGLPDSPALCLDAIAGGRSCVLILDQLDAIRWTSKHSASALDVCKELVNQVISLQGQGNPVSVVLSCRTFDLRHDPEIRNWLDDSKEKNRVKIEVFPLPQVTVSKTVGAVYTGMTERQKAVLSNPQNLGMWVELGKQEELPPFRSATELLRAFWEFRRKQIENYGIPLGEVNGILDFLVNWLEENGKISAPKRIIDRFSLSAIEALKSHGLIQEQSRKISFCHQSYLDFLIARRLLDEINEGGSISGWLGAKDSQTLFRREQLRQALALLGDESQESFLDAVKEVLSSNGIRFHLKHLVLELVGQVEDITGELADYCLSLLQDDYWGQHVFETVYYGHVSFVRLLLDRGVIARWLISSNEEDCARALMLLRSTADKMPDLVTEQLAPFLAQGEKWHKKILTAICWRVEDDSEAMFELRLQLARMGIFSNFIDWSRFCHKHPLRTLKLIEVALSIWQINEDETASSAKKIGRWHQGDLKALYQVVERFPEEAWECFIKYIARLTSPTLSELEENLREWRSDEDMEAHGYTGLGEGVVLLIIRAGQKMAEEKPGVLVKLTSLLESISSPIIQEILMEIYVYLPGGYADVGIGWLLSAPTRFAIKTREDEPKWSSAARLVKALSPHCSDALFKKLESSILEYHDPFERKKAEYCKKLRKKGGSRYFWGDMQFFLLPSLAPKRIQRSTNDLISMLRRRYERHSQRDFLDSWSTFGSVTSKLDKNLSRISNRSWLEIVNNNKIQEDAFEQFSHGEGGGLSLSSIRQFSHSLWKIAARFPETFGQLALNFSENTHPLYIRSILDAMALTKPDSDVPESERASWNPALIETVLSVCEKFRPNNNSEVLSSFCRLVSRRAGEDWPDSVVQKLLYILSYCNEPEPEKLNGNHDTPTEDDDVKCFSNKSLNSLRTDALGAIGKLLWHHQDWLDKVKPGIDSVVVDSNTDVRMAAVEMLLPVIKIDRQHAVSWFCQLSQEDDRVPASPYAMEFFNYTIREYSSQLKPIIFRMLNSPRPDVARQGAELATGYSLFHDLFWEEVELCRIGSLPQRKGGAKAATYLIREGKCAAKCRELLEVFFNDPEEEVRKETRSMFFDGFFDVEANISLAVLFVKSKAFVDYQYDILFELKGIKKSLLPYSGIILEICRVVSSTLPAETRNDQSQTGNLVRDISPLILRLYEQAHGKKNDVANSCLDAWDTFFEKRVGGVSELTRAMDS